MSLSKATPICANCNVVMRCERNGQLVHDPDCSGTTHDHPEEFTYWNGDLWSCPTCPASIVVGFGTPGLRHHQALEAWGRDRVDAAIPFRWTPLKEKIDAAS